MCWQRQGFDLRISGLPRLGWLRSALSWSSFVRRLYTLRLVLLTPLAYADGGFFIPAISFILNNMTFSKHTLKNGMRVVLVDMPENAATTVLTLVEAGSKYETKNINGLSHFLEHMVFKGTTKRPTALAISKELDGMGAEYNAFTSHEWTGYYAKVRTKDAEKALDIIADMYVDPLFDSAEIEKEKGVIIEEINMYEDMPQRRVGELFTNLLYGDQPAGWDIGGRKEVIRAMTRDHFLAYRKDHYVALATVVLIAGDMNANGGEAGLLATVEKFFKNMPVGEKKDKVPVVEKQSEPMVLLQHKASDQTHFVMGFRAFNAFNPQRYALQLMANILGGGMSSRLFQTVREEMGAAYYVNAAADLLSDHGFLAMSAGVEHSKLEAVLIAMLKEVERLRDTAVTDDELQHAKDHFAGRMMLGLETSEQLAMYYGGQEILEREMLAPERVLDKVRAVTPGDIAAVAQEIFANDKLNLAMIGPYEDREKLKKLLALS